MNKLTEKDLGKSLAKNYRQHIKNNTTGRERVRVCVKYDWSHYTLDRIIYNGRAIPKNPNGIEAMDQIKAINEIIKIADKKAAENYLNAS